MKTNILEREELAIVSCAEFAQKLNLKTVFEGSGSLTLTAEEINRPGLQLAGYFDHFVPERIQVIGNAENTFMKYLPEKIKIKVLDQYFSKQFPCLIVCRDLEIDDYIIEFAKKYDIPLFSTGETTTNLIGALNEYLTDLLAPNTILHGVMLDISGTGVLITGSAGIGKSETALELILRGHRLVADDSVIAKVKSGTILAKCPQKIRYFMEVRGIGIVNVKNMFGPGSVLLEKSIDLIVNLVPWEEMTEYDRLGDETPVTDILGIGVKTMVIPVSPGRNVPILIETAARKVRLEQFGYNAVEELINSAFKKEDK
ncbi:MAG: HPr(Ser) kinase/phosphatase [Clostridia bacterium]|nr:HPr(Ser) kinase/phosphatase [Clostridia bacterium]